MYVYPHATLGFVKKNTQDRQSTFPVNEMLTPTEPEREARGKIFWDFTVA